MKKYWLFFLVLLTFACQSENHLKRDFFWGIVVEGFPITQEQLQTTEEKLSIPFQIVNFFVQWPDEADFAYSISSLNESLNVIWEREAVPCVTWEPMRLENGQEVTIPVQKIVDGSYDAYIEAFADTILCFERPVIIRFAHEMNLERYHWGTTKEEYGQENSEIYRDLFRYVVTKFQEMGAINAFFAFCPNATSVPGSNWNRIANYYPGNGYVDILGMDGYNWGETTEDQEGWDGNYRSFEEIFASCYQELRNIAPDKPLMVFETATIPEKRVEWIQGALETAQKWNLQAILWFDVNKERDWGLKSDEVTLLVKEIRQQTTSSHQAMEKWMNDRGDMKEATKRCL